MEKAERTGEDSFRPVELDVRWISCGFTPFGCNRQYHHLVSLRTGVEIIVGFSALSPRPGLAGRGLG